MVSLQQSEKELHDEWDDSLLTKDEIEARLQRKVEAVMKRERALAYAYSHQVINLTSFLRRSIIHLFFPPLCLYYIYTGKNYVLRIRAI